MTPASWIWISLVLAAAGAQTIRNAAQRSLVESTGTLAATLVRFLDGLPFTFAALGIVVATSPGGLPAPSAPFPAWVALGAIAQLVATAFLVRAMAARSFVVAVTFSKTEIIQIGLFSYWLDPWRLERMHVQSIGRPLPGPGTEWSDRTGMTTTARTTCRAKRKRT